MFKEFKEWIKPFSERMENILKFGRFTNVSGSNGKLQEIQLKTIRNIEDAFKVGNFGFNSKAPIGSRAIVAKIGNEKIVIANEHLASIIDISSGNTVIYNQSGHTIKIEGDDITTTAPNIISNCENYTVNATSKFTVNSPVAEINAILNSTNNANFTGTTVKHNGTDIGDNHFHTQENDSDGDSEADTSTPTS